MDLDFTELLRRAKAGDGAALTQLHARYERRVLGVVRRRLGPALRRRRDSSDFVQSVFEDVLRDLPRLEDRGEEAFRHWLYLKSENKVRDAWRRGVGRDGNPREAELPSSDEPVGAGCGPATEAGDADEAVRLRTVFASLPAAQRDVIALRSVEGLGFAEIAVRLGLPGADAARMRYARALVALRARWAGGDA